MTALTNRIRDGIETIGKLREEAKERVDRFEAKARERLDGLRADLVARQARVKTQVQEQVVIPLHKVLDLPTHGDIAEVSAKVDQLQVRVDELIEAEHRAALAKVAAEEASIRAGHPSNDASEATTAPSRPRVRR